MEAFTHHVSELSSHALLIYRTTVIKAELRRRRAIANAPDGHSIITTEVSTTAPSTSSVIYSSDHLEMKRAFDLFDEDKDGLISVQELQVYMKRLGFNLTDQTVRGIVESVDQNSDQSVDLEEFCSLYKSLSNERAEAFSHACPIASEDDDHEEEALLKAFFIFDENKDGGISALELQQVLLKLGIPEGKCLHCCKKMIEKVDADGNGKVDFFEFKEMMCSGAYWSGSS